MAFLVVSSILLRYGSARDIILAYLGALYAVKPRNWEFGDLYTPPIETDSEADDPTSDESDASYVNTSSDDEESKVNFAKRFLTKIDPRAAVRKGQEALKFMKSISNTIYSVQVGIAHVSDKVEQIKNLHQWKVPLLTTIYMGVLCIVVVATNFLGLSNLLLVGLWFKMGKGALRKYQLLGGIVKPHPPHRVSHNPAFDFLSRVPTDSELAGYTQPAAMLAGRLSTTRRTSRKSMDPRSDAILSDGGRGDGGSDGGDSSDDGGGGGGGVEGWEADTSAVDKRSNLHSLISRTTSEL